MAKDTHKYRYIEAAILRGSKTLASIEQDAAEHHMSEHLGKLLALRIADYYQLAERLGTYSVEGLVVALSWGAVPSGSAASSHDATTHAHTKLLTAQESEEATRERSENLDENAAAANDYWSTQ